ncbi:DUF5994 family protein [Mycolicibacterium fluoranthenivorans]|uniref:Uncharacterized protein n=1 Tax=Mycolicibacterium fluoranthenivorans TaxID=258505 RepID=A0A7X5U015_9MYCO|nr:DUF5994 family protein [Mycolicibacterium fluoranthenivorans]MCV7357981.1 hypothetical protein [Mycolicibacterium fluoranthenivorans]NIH95900.1 hypothetical protein [Mycolicibacterium fluoranthenivorans]
MNDTLPRLRLTGRRAPSEHIDGAWWPTSKRLADELPALMAAVSDVMPHIAMVGYRRDGWIAPPSLTLDGAHPVELLEFVSSEPPTVILIGEDGHHLTLRIIDPDTDEGQAQRSLAEIPRRTADIAPAGGVHARSVHEVAKKLAEHEGRNDPARDAQILQWCQDAAVQFDEARIQTFVPILVEHIVNNRIHHEHHSATVSMDQPAATE